MALRVPSAWTLSPLLATESPEDAAFTPIGLDKSLDLSSTALKAILEFIGEAGRGDVKCEPGPGCHYKREAEHRADALLTRVLLPALARRFIRPWSGHYSSSTDHSSRQSKARHRSQIALRRTTKLASIWPATTARRC